MKFEILKDEEANTIYYKLSNKKVDNTKEVDKDFILVDYAKDGSIVGIEILNMKKMMEIATLTATMTLLPKDIRKKIQTA